MYNIDMNVLAVIDTLTTMNDLKGGNNCPVAFLVDVFEEECFFDGRGNPKTKEIFMVPDEPVLGNGRALHGIVDGGDSETDHTFLSLEDGLKKTHEILSAFAKNGICVAGYGIESFDLKTLNENFTRVLGEPPVIFERKHLIDVERLSKLLVDVRKCGNYSQSSVLATVNYSTFESLRGIVPYRKSISETEALLRELTNNFQVGKSLEEISNFLSVPHDVEVFQSGKYKGMKIEDVYNIDRQYFTWILKNKQFYENDKDMLDKVKTLVNREE